jgi:hypothetical protein
MRPALFMIVRPSMPWAIGLHAAPIAALRVAFAFSDAAVCGFAGNDSYHKCHAAAPCSVALGYPPFTVTPFTSARINSTPGLSWLPHCGESSALAFRAFIFSRFRRLVFHLPPLPLSDLFRSRGRSRPARPNVYEIQGRWISLHNVSGCQRCGTSCNCEMGAVYQPCRASTHF